MSKALWTLTRQPALGHNLQLYQTSTVLRDLGLLPMWALVSFAPSCYETSCGLPLMHCRHKFLFVHADGTIGATIHVAIAGKNLYGPKKLPSNATFSLHRPLKPLTCPFSSQSSGTTGRHLLTGIPAPGPWAQVGNVWQGQQVYTGQASTLHALPQPDI